MGAHLYSLHITKNIDIFDVTPLLNSSNASYIENVVSYFGEFSKEQFPNDLLDALHSQNVLYVVDKENFRSLYSPAFEGVGLKKICKTMTNKTEDAYIVLVNSKSEDCIEVILYYRGENVSKICFDEYKEKGKMYDVEVFTKLFNITEKDIEDVILKSNCIFNFCKNLGALCGLEFSWDEDDAKKNASERVAF